MWPRSVEFSASHSMQAPQRMANPSPIFRRFRVVRLQVCSGAAGLAIATFLLHVILLPKRVIAPLTELASFSEKLAAGDARAKAEITSTDEFGFIADNLNRSAAKVARTSVSQEASESLQRSITDLLNLINQVSRGDLLFPETRGRRRSRESGRFLDRRVRLHRRQFESQRREGGALSS